MVHKEPKISILIATFQAGEFLQECLDSIQKQSYKNMELVIVDGASTDSTLSIIESNLGLISTYISEPDMGIYDAMNKGVKLATGDYILFLGADDTLLVDLAEIASLLGDSTTIYYGDVLFKQSGIKYDGEFGAYKLAIKNICHQAIFYPSSVFKKYSFELPYKLLADHALNIKLYGDKNFSFSYFPFVIAKYNQTGLSASTIDSTYIAARMKLIYDNFSSFVYLYAKLRMMLAKYVLRKSQYNTK
ncbi:MAG: hypothetical protein CFE21_12145 [Bacteroidetes bacterium B1(2017)]|nr:MAG: hypothetical protein CFE21_12145 [Bacteroidetes bacterium B1(2017)]